jgi:hypothetical protein
MVLAFAAELFGNTVHAPVRQCARMVLEMRK